MIKDIKKRSLWVLKALKKTYPTAHCELNYSSPFELLIATILSAQCTDKRVNLVTEELFKKYKKPSDYAQAPIKELEESVRSTGFYRNKARNIQGASKVITEKFHSKVPETMEELVALPGVGRKTANVVLGNAFGKSEGVVVDTHVTRITRLLGFTRNTDAVKIERDLVKLVPKKDWTLVSHLLIWHGRRCCVARRPDCAHCILKTECPYGIKMSRHHE